MRIQSYMNGYWGATSQIEFEKTPPDDTPAILIQRGSISLRMQAPQSSFGSEPVGGSSATLEVHAQKNPCL
jgi:hypothetical protein